MTLTQLHYAVTRLTRADLCLDPGAFSVWPEDTEFKAGNQ